MCSPWRPNRPIGSFETVDEILCALVIHGYQAAEPVQVGKEPTMVVDLEAPFYRVWMKGSRAVQLDIWPELGEDSGNVGVIIPMHRFGRVLGPWLGNETYSGCFYPELEEDLTLEDLAGDLLSRLECWTEG